MTDPNREEEIRARLAVLRSEPVSWYVEGLGAHLDALREAPNDVAWLLSDLARLRTEAHPMQEALDDLVEWATDLRAKAKDAASFWDEFVGPSEKGHPSDELFAELAGEMDVDESLEEARSVLRATEEHPNE